MRLRTLVFYGGMACCLAAQTPAPEPAAAPGESPGAVRPANAQGSGGYMVESGTRIPLSLINSVSTKNSAAGDRVYLETAFPILANQRVVIPPGSYVEGTVTSVKKPGRIKGRGELYVRFDSLILPNGVTRDFRARMGSVDGQSNEQLDRKEGKVQADGNKMGDARTVAETAATGTWIGAIAGSAAGRPGMGAGMGAAAGAGAGLVAVLLTRGPDAVLARGTTVEMVLDRRLSFSPDELEFGNYKAPRPPEPGVPAANQKRRSGVPAPGQVPMF
jgi:type IV secretion system protein VirB10